MSLWRLFVFNLISRWKERQTKDLPMANLMVEMFPALKKRLES